MIQRKPRDGDGVIIPKIQPKTLPQFAAKLNTFPRLKSSLDANCWPHRWPFYSTRNSDAPIQPLGERLVSGRLLRTGTLRLTTERQSQPLQYPATL